MNLEYIGSHLKCSEEEKRYCLQVLEVMIEVGDVARSCGIFQ